MSERDPASRLHEGLVAAFTVIYGGLDGARVQTTPDYAVLVCPTLPLPQFNSLWVGCDGEASVAALSTAVREIETLGLPFWLQTRAARHPLVEAEAARLGLELVEQIIGMVAIPVGLAVAPADEIVIERVLDVEMLAAAAWVAETGFEVPAGMLGPLYGERLAATPGMAYYLGLLDGEPVATALGSLCGDSIGIFNVATLPGHRGRGFGTALSARAVHDGFDRGARLAFLQASGTGESVYRSLGFSAVETYRLFTSGGPDQ